MRFNQISIFIVLLSVLCSAVSWAEEPYWKYSTGIDYSTGDYGGDPADTDILYIPFTTSYTTGQWRFKATIPWVQIDGPGTVIGAGGGGIIIDDPDANAEATKESGLGDIWLTAIYSVESVPAELFFLDVGAKYKLPTADEDKGLGTGETDWTLQAEIFKSLGNVSPFLTVAYKFKGEPSGADLDDVIYLSAGADFRLSDQSNFGVSLDYQESSTSTGDDSLELFGYLNYKLDSQWSLMPYAYLGLEDGSPDYGVGFQVSYKP